MAIRRRAAGGALAAAWWTLLVLRGLLPALFAIAMGGLVGAVEKGNSLVAPLAAVGVLSLRPSGIAGLAPLAGHAARSGRQG